MTRKKLQKVLRQIAYEENITTWKWSNFEYYLHQNNDDLAVTRTQNGGKARKLLSHEETIRALKVYNVWKTRQYAQAILEVLFEQNSYFETDKDIFYIVTIISWGAVLRPPKYGNKWYPSRNQVFVGIR